MAKEAARANLGSEDVRSALNFRYIRGIPRRFVLLSGVRATRETLHVLQVCRGL